MIKQNWKSIFHSFFCLDLVFSIPGSTNNCIKYIDVESLNYDLVFEDKNDIYQRFSPMTMASEVKEQIMHEKEHKKTNFFLTKLNFLCILICFCLSFSGLQMGYERIGNQIIETDEWRKNNNLLDIKRSQIVYAAITSSFLIGDLIGQLFLNFSIFTINFAIVTKKNKILNFLFLNESCSNKKFILIQSYIVLGVSVNLIGAGLCIGSKNWIMYMIGKFLQGCFIGINNTLIPFFIKYCVLNNSTKALTGIVVNMYSLNIKNGTLTGYIVIYCCKKWYIGTDKVWVYPNIGSFIYCSVVIIGILIFNFIYLPLSREKNQEQDDCECKCSKEYSLTNKKNKNTNSINTKFFNQTVMLNKKKIIQNTVICILYSLNPLEYFFYYSTIIFENLAISNSTEISLVFGTVLTFASTLASLIPFDIALKTSNNPGKYYIKIIRVCSFLNFIFLILMAGIGYTKLNKNESMKYFQSNRFTSLVLAMGVLTVFNQTFAMEIPYYYFIINSSNISQIQTTQMIQYIQTVCNIIVTIITPILNEHIGFLLCLIFGGSALALTLFCFIL